MDAATRESLHAVAEHVMATAMYDSIGKIGLRAHPGGFATQEFDGRVLAVEHGELTDGSVRLALHGCSMREVADAFHVRAKDPIVYEASTPLDRNATLVVDPADATAIGEWFSLVEAALVALKPADAVIQIWPEHFDIACDFGRVNYGASPGDAARPERYLYVGPWDVDAARAKHPDAFTDSWGVALPASAVSGVDDALAFFQQGKHLFG